MRRDAFGFMWDDSARYEPKKPGEKAPRGPRPIPEIPDTGWKPKPFPRLDKARIIALDTETKDPDLEEKGPGVRRDGCHIVGISCATEDGHSWYFPMRHELGGEMNLPPENVIAWAKDELTRPNQPKVGTNLLYDLDFLAEEGVEVAGPFYDVQVAEALLDENRYTYALDSLAWDYLKHGKVSEVLADWVQRAYGNKNFRAEIYRSPPALVGPYAEGDALQPIEILQKQLPRIRAEGLERLWEIEAGQTEILLGMRRRGVRINLERAQEVEGLLEQNIANDKAKLNTLAGFEVNVDTKDHLIKLFDGLKLSYPFTAPTKRHPNGQPSFVKEFLENHDHPDIQLISDIRRWEKFRDTFIRGYIYNLHVNGRIHCLFNQVKGDEYGAVSGRYSSSLPNLQNIPVRHPLGKRIREIFWPDEGDDWDRLDWSQIEYRFLVHFAFHMLNGRLGSTTAVERYRSDPNTDYHNFVSDITHVERKHAKNINFGLVYGMGEPELARQLGLDLSEAKPIFNTYHGALPFVQEIRKHVASQAAQQGYITTILGRRRRFNLWQPKYGTGQERALPMEAAIGEYGTRLRRAYTHKGLNALVQGSAADLMKLAMYEYSKRKDLISVLGFPLLTVHDELDNSRKRRSKIAREAVMELKRIMETCLEIAVPIVAEYETGPNWGETK